MHYSATEDKEVNEKKTLTADILGLNDKLGTRANKLEILFPKLLGPRYRYLVEKGSKAFEPFKYEKQHLNWHKHFIYSSSRQGIVFNPIKTNKISMRDINSRSLHFLCIRRNQLLLTEK